MPTPARDAWIAATVALAACGTYTTYQTAEPLGRGGWRLAAGASGGAFRDAPSDLRTPAITAEVALHRGVGASTDLGVRLYTVGGELQVKHRFVDACWQWAIAGAIGGLRTWAGPARADALTGHVRATVIATRRTSRRLAFSVGPVVTGGLFYPAGGGHATGVLLGGFANLAWAFGGAWALVPELSVHRTMAGDVPVDGGIGQIGVAVSRRW